MVKEQLYALSLTLQEVTELILSLRDSLQLRTPPKKSEDPCFPR